MIIFMHIRAIKFYTHPHYLTLHSIDLKKEGDIHRIFILFQFLSRLQLCTVNPCENGGTCWTSNESFYCACRPGYTGKLCEGM